MNSASIHDRRRSLLIALGANALFLAVEIVGRLRVRFAGAARRRRAHGRRCRRPRDGVCGGPHRPATADRAAHVRFRPHRGSRGRGQRRAALRRRGRGDRRGGAAPARPARHHRGRCDRGRVLGLARERRQRLRRCAGTRTAISTCAARSGTCWPTRSDRSRSSSPVSAAALFGADRLDPIASMVIAAPGHRRRLATAARRDARAARGRAGQPRRRPPCATRWRPNRAWKRCTTCTCGPPAASRRRCRPTWC